MGVHRGYRTVAAAIVVVLTGGQAAAQSAPPAATVTSSDAKAHFERGVTLYDEADYAAALVEFKRAYALAPAWQVLFNIGQAYFQVRNYADALAALRQFVDEGRDQIPEERRTLVQGELADLADRIGYVNITSDRVGAALTIDDRTAGVTPLRERVLVSVGVRRIVAVFPGLPPVAKDVSVPAGETVDVALDFGEPSPTSAPATEDEASDSAPTAAEAAPVRSRNRTPAIVSFAVATAGAATGAIFGSFALHDKSRLNGECQGKACSVGSQADIDAVSRNATISTIGFAVMGAGVALGIGLWLTARGSPANHPDTGRVTSSNPTLSLRIVPGCIAGSF